MIPIACCRKWSWGEVSKAARGVKAPTVIRKQLVAPTPCVCLICRQHAIKTIEYKFKINLAKCEPSAGAHGMCMKPCCQLLQHLCIIFWCHAQTLLNDDWIAMQISQRAATHWYKWHCCPMGWAMIHEHWYSFLQHDVTCWYDSITQLIIITQLFKCSQCCPLYALLWWRQHCSQEGQRTYNHALSSPTLPTWRFRHTRMVHGHQQVSHTFNHVQQLLMNALATAVTLFLWHAAQ